MTDSILDELEPPEFVDTSWQRAKRRLVRSTCCGHTRSGASCRRAGMIVRDSRSYCWAHDPGPEAA